MSAGQENDGLEALFERARKVRTRAYAPYSRYRVGAVLEASGGRIHVGCNVENASYGLSLCAERSALARAVAEGDRRFRRIVLCADGPDPPVPCGACRQALAEFEPRLAVHSEGDEGRRVRWGMETLLPERFSLTEGNPNDRGGRRA